MTGKQDKTPCHLEKLWAFIAWACEVASGSHFPHLTNFTSPCFRWTSARHKVPCLFQARQKHWRCGCSWSSQALLLEGTFSVLNIVLKMTPWLPYFFVTMAKHEKTTAKKCEKHLLSFKSTCELLRIPHFMDYNHNHNPKRTHHHGTMIPKLIIIILGDRRAPRLSVNKMLPAWQIML